MKKIYLCVLSLALTVSMLGQVAQAQNRIDASRSTLEGSNQKTELSEAALARMAARIAEVRQQKRDMANTFESPAGARQMIAAVRDKLFAGAADVTYNGSYFDTQAGDQFSFPEDTHDYCHAWFMSDDTNQDYYLNASIDPGASLAVTVTWTTAADYDLYLFDVEGYPVGDQDPNADFNGANGVNFQSDAAPLMEEATIVHDRGAASDEFVVVVDRFRGEGGNNDLAITISGNDDTFTVLEYIGQNNLTYLNADVDGNGTDETIGSLMDGLVLSAEMAASFNAQFNTDGCAESIVFTMVDQDGNPVLDGGGNPIAITDNERPFSAFGDDAGDFLPVTLEPGMYTLTATPYSRPDGNGASNSPLSATLMVSGDGNLASIVSFSLIDEDTGLLADPAYETILPDTTIDLVGLPVNLAIRANPEDPGAIIKDVVFTLEVAQVGGSTTQTIPDFSDSDGLPYLRTWLNDGVFRQAATFPVGAYAVTATPSGDEDPSQYIAGAIQFNVVGPRISNYTLINAATDLPIAEHDPIENGAEFNLAEFALQGITTFNIRANTRDFGQLDTGETDPSDPRLRSIDAVKFDIPNLEGEQAQESYRPYAVFADCNQAINDCNVDIDPPYSPINTPEYEPWTPVPGTFELTGIPYFSVVDDIRFSEAKLEFSVVASMAGRDGEMDEGPTLMPNFPNPFNPVTTILFSLPEPAPVSLTVHDMLGRTVKVLVDGAVAAGFHKVSFEAGNLASGLYMYRLETPAGVLVRPMTLLK